MDDEETAITLASIRIGRVSAGARRRMLLSAGRGPAPPNVALAFTREQTLGVLHPGGSLSGKAFVAAAGGRRMLLGEGDRAAGLALTIQIVAKHKPGGSWDGAWNVAIAMARREAARR